MIKLNPLQKNDQFFNHNIKNSKNIQYENISQIMLKVWMCRTKKTIFMIIIF